MGCGGEGGAQTLCALCHHTVHSVLQRRGGGAQMAKMDPTIYGAANMIVPLRLLISLVNLQTVFRNHYKTNIF